MVVVIASIVLLPIGMVMGSLVRDWNTAREIKRLQEDLDLAAYAIKGVMEEAYGYDVQDDTSGSSVVLDMDASGNRTIVIEADGGKLMLDGQEVIGSLANLSFESDNGLLIVRIQVGSPVLGPVPETILHVLPRNRAPD